MSTVPPVEPSQPSGDQPQQGPDIGGLMKAPVRTTEDIKAAMISYLGEEEGIKMYNSFMQTMGMMMLSQVQKAAEQARKAAQEMRKAGQQ